MLIRFLSYLASIIGARRYKPLLISCLALVFSVTSIAVLISTVSSDSFDAASTVKQEENQSSKNPQSSSPGLSGFEQKTTKDEGVAPGDRQNGESDTPPETKQQASGQNTAFDIIPNTATVSLSQDSPGAAVTVTVSDNDNDTGKVQWSISPDNTGSGLTARIEPVKDNPGNAVIRFRADTLTAGIYQFTVTAKTLSGAQSASKTISVTVN